jgi:hypothetical protein
MPAHLRSNAAVRSEEGRERSCERPGAPERTPVAFIREVPDVDILDSPDTPQAQPMTLPSEFPPPHDVTERAEAFLKLATRMDWEIERHDATGILLRRRKRYGAGYFLVGAVTAIIGIGLIIWLAGWVDYATDKDRLVYVPVNDLMTMPPKELADFLK